MKRALVILMGIICILFIGNILLLYDKMNTKFNTRLCIRLHNGTNTISAKVPSSLFRFFFTESPEPFQKPGSNYKGNAKYIDKCLIECNGSIVSNDYSAKYLVGFFEVTNNWTVVKMYIIITNMPYNKEIYINLSRPL